MKSRCATVRRTDPATPATAHPQLSGWAVACVLLAGARVADRTPDVGDPADTLTGMPTPTRAAAVALTAVAAVAGCGTTTSPATPTTTAPAPLPLLARGTATLILPHFQWDPGAGCWGVGTHADVTGGGQVTVTDATGAVVALGKLDPGTPSMSADDPTRARLCLLTFRVPDVPAGKGFYTVTVGAHPGVKVTEADMGEPVAVPIP